MEDSAEKPAARTETALVAKDKESSVPALR
jgi:hypothetical protein